MSVGPPVPVAERPGRIVGHERLLVGAEGPAEDDLRAGLRVGEHVEVASRQGVGRGDGLVDGGQGVPVVPLVEVGHGPEGLGSLDGGLRGGGVLGRQAVGDVEVAEYLRVALAHRGAGLLAVGDGGQLVADEHAVGARRVPVLAELAQEPEIGQPLEEVALADNLVLSPLLEVALGDAVEGGQQVVDVLDDVVIALPLVVAERAVCQRGQVTLGIVNRVAGGDATGAQHGSGLEGAARGGEQVIDTRGWQVGVAAVQGQFRHVGRGDGPLEVQLVHGVEVQHVHHLAADEAYHYQQDE